MFIRSERLFLRPAWPEDADDLYATIADERIVRNLARAPWPYTLQDAHAFLALPQNRRYPSLLITLPGVRGSRLIGGVGLHEAAAQAELGYWIAPEAWGRGYASEAASAVLRVARTLGHRRIGAHHFLDNPASGRVLEKLGFARSGVTHRPSLARGCSAPSCGYLLSFDSPGDSDCNSILSEDSDPGMRAA